MSNLTYCYVSYIWHNSELNAEHLWTEMPYCSEVWGFWKKSLMLTLCYIYLMKIQYIYIYAFSRCFYPKRLTIVFRFVSICVPWESNPQPFALLTQCSTTEPHWNTDIVKFYFKLYLYEYFPVLLSWISCSHYFSLQCHMILQECFVFAYYQCFFGKCDSYIYIYIYIFFFNE